MPRIILPFLVLISSLVWSQPFPQAHAHNDYEQTLPLFDALYFGFGSVEADIYLVRGKLLVSHLYPLFGAKTLDELYLHPLDSLAEIHGGRIFPRSDHTFYLMIDIKSDGAETYPVLKELVLRHPGLFRSGRSFLPVTIFLSGNRPMEQVLHDKDSLFALDGRPADLGKSFSTRIMPIISDNYNQWSDWNGQGSADLKKIRQLAARVHAEGKRLRLWAIPDNPSAWKVLLEAGVDILNSDHLRELSAFLQNAKK